VTTALPVRIPQISGNVSVPPRPIPVYPSRYACEVDADGEHQVIREPDRRWCAHRAELLVGVAMAGAWTRQRRATEAAHGRSW
jgi:hypothetical protein